MMLRRVALGAALALSTLAALPAAAEGGPSISEIRAYFQNETRDVRLYVQQLLQNQGLYNSGLDGAWGPGMERAYMTMLSSPSYARHDWDANVMDDLREAMFFMDSLTWLGDTGYNPEPAPCPTCG